MSAGYVTVNDVQAVEARVSFPRVGAWTADVVLTDAVPAGPVTVVLAASPGGTPVTLKGTAIRSDTIEGTTRVRIVAGAGGLGKSLQAQGYYQVSLSLVLKDALRGAGEALSATASASVLNTNLPAWTRAAGAAGAVLQALAELAGVPWRFLQDGTIWIGAETWPAAAPDYQLLGKRPELGVWDVFVDPPALLPGTTFAGGKLSYVEYFFTEHQLRCRLTFEDTTVGSVDRVKGGLQRFFAQLFGRRLDYLASYACTAVSQNGDGTLELVPDSPRIGQLSHIPIRYGAPGISAQVAPGARVWLQYAEGNPSKPYATLWESATVTAFNLVTGAGATINIGGAASTMINLGAALQLVARSLDPLLGAAGPFPLIGTIGVPTQTNVKA